MRELAVCCLGSFSAKWGDRDLRRFRSNRVQALLVYLLVEQGTIHQREALLPLLWPDMPRPSAQVNLRQTIYQLRKMIPHVASQTDGQEIPLLLTDRKTIQLNPDAAISLDWRRFFADARRCRDGESLILLQQTVDLYRGPFLEDFYLPDSAPFEAWAQAKREAARREVLMLLEMLARRRMEAGDFTAAETAVRRQLHIDPLHNIAHRQLIELLARSGKRQQALAQYGRYQQLLADELGLQPAAATLLLHEQLIAGFLEETPPQKLRDYQIQEELGRGSFGVVYRAFQPHVARDVALKVIHPDQAAHPDFIQRFATEARLIAQLEHPHIVPLYDFWRDEQGAYLVLRLLDGGNLAQRLAADGPLPPDAALVMIRQIGEAVALAHAHGVVHQDVKPANILFDAQGHAYLSDFGIAREGTQTTGGGDFIAGSPLYMAPEQLRCEPVTPHADIYSLGLVLYEALSGKPPFVGEAISDVLQAQLQQPLPHLPISATGLPPGINDILQKACAKEAAHRFADVTIMLDALQALQQPERTVVETAVPPHNLPPDPTPFVGRAHELEKVVDLLLQPAHRLLTLTAQGGMGKTRLAIAAVRRLAQFHPEAFPDGLYFVPLENVTGKDDILPAIAVALQLEGGGSVIRYCRRRRLILLLDNFEQLLDDDGYEIVLELLDQAPTVTVLISSREPLRVRQEQRYPLGGLDYPQTTVSAAALLSHAAPALFWQSVQRLDPGRNLTAPELPDLLEICRHVDGMPLALELAAGWAETMPLTEIVAELDHSLEILETDLRDMPARHRSMEAVIAASWRRLPVALQALFIRLAVFHGGFDQAAAKAVAGASRMQLTKLVGRGWLQQGGVDGGLQLHPLLWQYGQEQLAAAGPVQEAIAEKHTVYFLAQVARWAAAFIGPGGSAALRDMALAEADCRAVWRRLVAAVDLTRMHRLAGPLATYYARWSRPAALAADFGVAITRLQPLPGGEAKRLLAFMKMASHLFSEKSRKERIETFLTCHELLAEAAVDGVDIRFEKGLLLRHQIYQGVDMGMPDAVAQMEKRCAEAVALFTEIGGQQGKYCAADVQLRLGDKLLWQGNYDRADRLLSASLKQFEAIGAESVQPFARSMLGFNRALHGDLKDGEMLLRRSLAQAEAHGELRRQTASVQYFHLGLILSWQGEFSVAGDTFSKSVAITRDLGLPNYYALPYQAYMAAHLGRPQEIHRLVSEELHCFAGDMNPFNRQETESALGYAALWAGEYTPARAYHEPVVTAGAKLGLLSHYAEDLAGLVLAERGLNRSTAAADWLQRFITEILSSQTYYAGITGLALLALLLTDAAEYRSGIRLHQFLLQFPYYCHSQWFARMFAEPITQAAASANLELADLPAFAHDVSLWDFLKKYRNVLTEKRGEESNG